jgi:hypothetical protein
VRAAKSVSAAAALVLVLTGCATTPQAAPQGNFLPDNIDQAKLASEAVRQLVVLYAPARTRLALQHAATDKFGMALIKGLRDSGYAVQEFAPGAERKHDAAPAKEGDALPLRYVADPVGSTSLYRITVAVGGQSLTRLYTARDGAVLPAGTWVRKE